MRNTCVGLAPRRECLAWSCLDCSRVGTFGDRMCPCQVCCVQPRCRRRQHGIQRSLARPFPNAGKFIAGGQGQECLSPQVRPRKRNLLRRRARLSIPSLPTMAATSPRKSIGPSGMRIHTRTLTSVTNGTTARLEAKPSHNAAATRPLQLVSRSAAPFCQYICDCKADQSGDRLCADDSGP